MKCWPFMHDWPKWDEPKTATASGGEPVLVQRRACTRCNRVRIRRVLVTN